MSVGRTLGRFADFRIHDNGATMRSIPVTSINGVGLTHEEIDVSALQDAVKNTLPGQPEVTIEISGPFSNDPAAAAGTLSGSHTILSGIVGGLTPLSMDVQVGIIAAWQAGDPQFGLTATASDGMICTAYTVDIAAMTYSAMFKVMGGTAPAWGTAAES